MLEINKDEWESIKVCGKWRFVDHKNRLLSVGWFDEFELDISKIRLTQDSINSMRENYQDYLD
tara:strand:+ start:305 stop:493 length:189 start_codon:yes stop_codon:yes gene_type:complete